MTAYKPWLQDMTEAQLRQWLAYQFQQSSTGVAKTGVLAGLGCTPTSPSPSGSVVIGKGAAVCQPSSQAFPLVEPSDETFDVFTANPMQFVNNPRNDIIVLDQVTGLVKNLVGTPNAVPSSGEQSAPATAVPLARLRHAANATTIPGAKIDDLRVLTGLGKPGPDTGWLNLPGVPAGWSSPTGTPWQARRLGSVVYFRGSLQNSSFSGFATIGTLPAGIPAPGATVGLPVGTATSSSRYITVETSGAVEAYSESASTGVFHIGGSYLVD